MSIAQHYLSGVINGTPPPRHMAKTREAARKEEFETNVSAVADILESMGHDPVKVLVEIEKDKSLSPHQRASINKWLMEMAHAKPKALEVSAPGGGPIEFVISEVESKL